MPTIIDSLIVKLGLDPSDMKSGAKETKKIDDKLREDLKKSGKQLSDADKKAAEEKKKHHKHAVEQSRSVVEGIRKIRNETLGLLGLYMGGVGIKNFVANTVEQAAGLKFLSENLDMSVESIQAYQRASERMGGSAAGMTAQLLESQRELSRLRTGQGPSEGMQATFRAAGMAGDSLNQSDLSTGNNYLMARARIIAVLYKQNASNAALMAQQMGISEEQFNLIKQGPAAIQKLIEAQKKNSVISGYDAEQMHKLKNMWLDFTDSAQATGTKILVTLIPSLKMIMGWLQKLSDYINLHRNDIAQWIEKTIPKIEKLAIAFGEFVKNMDWKGIIADAKVLLDVLVGIATAIASIANFVMPKESDKSEFEKGADKVISDSFKLMFSMMGVGAGTVAPSTSNASNSTKNDIQITVNGANDPAGSAKAIDGVLSKRGLGYGTTGMW